MTLDGDAKIPWSEIVSVVNLVKRCGIETIEFAMGAPPPKATDEK